MTDENFQVLPTLSYAKATRFTVEGVLTAEKCIATRIGIGTIAPRSLLDITGDLTREPSVTGAYLSLRHGTLTDSGPAGTRASAVFSSFAAPTLSSTAAITTTNAATVYIAGAPTAGGSQTITNPYSLWVGAGATKLGGALSLSGDLVIYNSSDVTKYSTLTTGSTGDLTIVPSGGNIITGSNVDVGFGFAAPAWSLEVLSRGKTGGAGVDWSGIRVADATAADSTGLHLSYVPGYGSYIGENMIYNNAGQLKCLHTSGSMIYSAGGYLRFQTYSGMTAGVGNITPQNRMSIDPSGYVGIGTTAPAKRLDVLDGSAAQLRLSYNASVVTDFTTDVSGNLTIAPSSSIIFTRSVHIVGSSASGGAQVSLNSGGQANCRSMSMAYNPVGGLGSVTGDYCYISCVYSGIGYVPLAINPSGGSCGIGSTNPQGKLESSATADQLVLSHSGDPTNDKVAFSVDTSGYLTINPSGDRLYVTDLRATTAVAGSCMMYDTSGKEVISNSKIAFDTSGVTGVAFGSSNGSGTLNWYETYSNTFNVTGPWASGTKEFTIKIIRVGSLVTLTMLGVSFIGDGTADTLTATTPIPSQFRPSAAYEFAYANVEHEGVPENGAISVTSSGFVQILRHEADIVTGRISVTTLSGTAATVGLYSNATISYYKY